MEQIYRVSFFKKLVDDYGHPADACQGVIEVHAPSREKAIERARRKFAKAAKIPDWSLHADYEVAEALPGRKHVSMSAWSKGLEGQPSRR